MCYNNGTIKQYKINIKDKKGQKIMIKYYYKPSTRQTFAVLNGCRFDAVNKIGKLMGNLEWCMCSNKYMMNDTYRVSVKCSDEDVFSEEEGRKQAKAKLMKKYYKDFDRCVDRFKTDLIELNGRVFETPAELEENTP